MKYENAQGVLQDVVMAMSHLEGWSRKLHEQSEETQAAIRTTREREEARCKQAIVAMHEDQQRLIETTLRPKIVRAWQIVAGLAGLGVLLFTGYLLLLSRADARLRAAEARADAAEIRAEVKEAMRRLDMTSCGGRPCIRVDKHTPKWKSGNGEYILADGPALR